MVKKRATSDHPINTATRPSFPSPQEKKLFFEFVEGLEKFEVRNGLDHFCVRPDSGRGNAGNGSKEDSTTVLHLGPMLKAAIRFYV